MIHSFRHKGIEKFFRTGSKAGIQAQHAQKLRRQLARLDASSVPGDMDIPVWRLHTLKGGLSRHYSVRVDGNWRLTFAFEEDNVILVDYRDYH